MRIASPEFKNNTMIPQEYTCQGADVNPPLNIEDMPVETKSMALIVDDPDAPSGTWVHWVVYDMLPTVTKIDRNSVPGKQGTNDFQKKEYGGPCPPSGTHRYFFKVYALDTVLDLEEGLTKGDLNKAMQGHILDQAELVGMYQKK